jgi:hypothetical protein
MAELMGDHPEVDLSGFQEEWFDPAEGLRLVQGLLDHLGNDPRALRRLEKGDTVEARWLLEDLEEAAKILRAAEGEGVRFHFAWAY